MPSPIPGSGLGPYEILALIGAGGMGQVWNARDTRLDRIFAISFDGRFVASTSNESGRFEVYVQTFPRFDNKWPISTSGGYEPRRREGGREIYYLCEDRKLMVVAVEAGPSFSRPKPLFETQVPAGVTPNRTNYVTSRDGRCFLVNTQTGDPAPIPITVVLNWNAGLKK